MPWFAPIPNYPVPREEIKFDDVTGLCNIDPMLETYAFSGDQHVLDQVLAAVKSPGVDGNVPRLGRSPLRSRAMPYAPTKNSACPSCSIPGPAKNAIGRLRFVRFDWVNEQNMLPYGVASGMENLAGIGAFRLTETCNVVGRSLVLRVDVSDRRRPVVRRRHRAAFFNAGPAPIARDFQTMCYYQSPNRIESETLPDEQPNAPGQGCLKFTRLGLSRTSSAASAPATA